MSAMEPDTEGTRLLVRDGVLREDERGQLTVYLCDDCATLNAGYGTCPYCSDASSCVVVRTADGTLLTMARPLADSLGIAPMRLGECRCCNEPPRDPYWARICVRGGDATHPEILSERPDGHTHTHYDAPPIKS
jgi:hypothetical protein